MFQINLYCPNCLAKLPNEAYLTPFRNGRRQLENLYCLSCVFPVVIKDVNKPDRAADLQTGFNVIRTRIEFERIVRKICVLTGKSAEFVQKFVCDAKLTLEDLNRLVEKIVLGEWSFEDEN